MNTALGKGTKILFAFGVLLLVAASLYSQPVTTDVSGYHVEGKASAPSQEEAQLLAKADALEKVFDHLKKDELFRTLFIRLWPQAIVQEGGESQSRESENGETRWEASILLRVDQNAVLLAEQRYQEDALGLLEKAEKLLSEVYSLIEKAEQAEADLDITMTFVYLKQGESKLRQASLLLNPLGDPSVQTETGQSVVSLRTEFRGLVGTIQNGLARVDDYENRARERQSDTEVRATFQLLERELRTITADTERHNELYPYYDLPRRELDFHKDELEDLQNRLVTVDGKLIDMDSAIGGTNRFYSEKIRIAISESGDLQDSLELFISAVNEEIGYPRLRRQADARSQAEMMEAASSTAQYVFLHTPHDWLVFRYYTWAALDVNADWIEVPSDEYRIRGERIFEGGFWLRGDLEKGRDPLNSSGDHIEWFSSTLGLGIGEGSFWGFGFSWDWWRKKVSGDNSTTIDNVLVLHNYFGETDPKRERPFYVVDLGYRLPSKLDAGIVSYILNFDAQGRLNLEDLLFLEARLASYTVQRKTADWLTDLDNSMDYIFEWSIGGAIRVPPPFSIGIHYYHNSTSPIYLGKTEDFKHQGYWRFFLEYSF